MTKARTAPWMPSGPTAARPLADYLPHTRAPVEASSWIAPSAAGFGASCPHCTDGERHQNALEADRAEARTAGHAEGLAATAQLRARMAAALAALESAHHTREAELTQLIVDVALTLCAELAPASAAIDARGVSGLVRTALGLSGARDVTLRLRADDATVLGGQLPSGLTCHIDPQLAPGELWVDAPRLVVDARWPTRLAALREPLLALVRAEEPMLEAVRPRRETAPPKEPDAG